MTNCMLSNTNCNIPMIYSQKVGEVLTESEPISEKGKKTKKPRSAKQIEAFEKMRAAKAVRGKPAKKDKQVKY